MLHLQFNVRMQPIGYTSIIAMRTGKNKIKSNSTAGWKFSIKTLATMKQQFVKAKLLCRRCTSWFVMEICPAPNRPAVGFEGFLKDTALWKLHKNKHLPSNRCLRFPVYIATGSPATLTALDSETSRVFCARRRIRMAGTHRCIWGELPVLAGLTR